MARLKTDEPLNEHTTFHIGGPARYYAEVDTAVQLESAIKLCYRYKLPLLVLGSGSNVLIGDHGFDGVVLRLAGSFTDFRFDGQYLRSGAGANLGLLVKSSAQEGLSGMEHLCGIPGTLGGAIRGNAGSREKWIGELVEELEVMTLAAKSEILPRSALEFSYRRFNGENMILTGAKLLLKKGLKNDILMNVGALMNRRTDTQPAGKWCAGSIFKNPPGDSAGRLIESCGLKGLTLGGAKISDIHANFIINTGSACSRDVRALIAIVHGKVKEKYGIQLELEIELIGE